MNKFLTLAACLVMTMLLNAQTRIFVTPNGSGNGASWVTAGNLENAVKNATSGTEIWVQKGIYYPSKMLIVPASVKIYGGFAGTETNLLQRNLVANPTIIDAQQKFGSVFRLENSAELDGFTIQNGNAQNNPHYNGGGVWADENTTIRYCTITNNIAFANGGGLYAKGILTLANTVVENNTATGDGADVWGNCIDTVILIDYTGAPQEVLLEPGTYTIECWGARGGDMLVDGWTGKGGRGAYTIGTLTLTSSLEIYAYVGQAPTDGPRGASAGGWNGGGWSSDLAPAGSWACAGGGATDIRLVNGTWDDLTSLRSRIMVAGAGGGSNDRVNGGNGGLVGSAGQNGGGGGSQTSGGSSNQFAGVFGKGGGYQKGTHDGGGGGSGYYGGGNYYGYGSAGGGGSSFISGHPGCNAINEDGTHKGNPNHYSGLVFTGTAIITGNTSMPNPRYSGNISGNSGHGFVRITFRK